MLRLSPSHGTLWQQNDGDDDDDSEHLTMTDHVIAVCVACNII